MSVLVGLIVLIYGLARYGLATWPDGLRWVALLVLLGCGAGVAGVALEERRAKRK